MASFPNDSADDVLHKNPFGFELATVVVDDSVTRESVTNEQIVRP